MMSPRKEKALQALLISRTRAEAAKAAGIGESTLRSYMQDPEFMERYREAFGNLITDATRQAQQSISPALSTLLKIVDDTGENAQARISAARSLLEFSLKLTEATDILTRLDDLETQANHEGS